LLHTWHRFPEQSDSQQLLDRWTKIRALRAQVLKKLEESRIKGDIGSSLAATVEIHTGKADFELLNSLGGDLKFVLITSETRLLQTDNLPAIEVFVTPSRHRKCERCWHYRNDVGSSTEHPTLCGRCVANLYGNGEQRKFA
jgi:isoleucyl-tRNA synthetase